MDLTSDLYLMPRCKLRLDMIVLLRKFLWFGALLSTGIILPLLYLHMGSRNSAIATGYGLDGRGVRVRVPAGAILFSPDRLWRPIGTGALSSP
jgi:hypothetical protein